MSKRGGRRNVAAVTVISVISASTVAGCLLGSFDDLMGGSGADASAAEAGSLDANTSTDASNDSDDTGISDAGSDARFCDKQIDAGFCDDFDETDAPALAQWQAPDVTGSNSLGLTSAALSPPNALLATIASNNSIISLTQPAASVSHQLPGTVKRARYVYDLLFDTYDTSGSEAYVGTIIERVGLTDIELRLDLVSNGFGLDAVVQQTDGGTTYPSLGPKLPLLSAAAALQWHHVEVDVDYTMLPATVTFIFDSTNVLSTTIPGAVFGAGQLTVQAGVLYARLPTSGWKMRVDNVAVFTE